MSLRSFKVKPGIESWCGTGARYFTRPLCPAGHLLVAECHIGALSLFSVTTGFVRTIGSSARGFPSDVDFAPNGDALVVDSSTNRVSVYKAGGYSKLREFGGSGKAGEGTCACAASLATFGGRLYVLDHLTNRVQVFQ